MSSNSAIEWTDATWNPVSGCTKVSDGCDHCYAERITERFHGKGSFAEVVLHPERLTLPLRWRKPRRVFVNSMSDLFHKDVPDNFIARAFAVMAATPRHTYQILTKRHGRMRALLSDPDGEFQGAVGEWRYEHGETDTTVPTPEDPSWGWPLPNVWLGVSVEDQQRADLRIPALLKTPAAVRFLSCEPLLGPIDLLGKAGVGCEETGPAITHEGVSQRTDYGTGVEYDCDHQVGVDWVIVGGESGAGARPMHPDWARSLRDQCVSAGVPFHFKQWGGRTPKSGGRELDGRTWDEFPEVAS